jgi:hypothetical protein
MTIIAFSRPQRRRLVPVYTSADLLASARNYTAPTVEGIDFEDFLKELPDLLRGVLDIGLENFDYHNNKRSTQAVMLRCIAAMLVRMEYIALAAIIEEGAEVMQ